MPDATIEAIVEAARKRAPKAKAVYVYPPDCSWDSLLGFEYSAALVVVYDEDGECPLHETAPDLPALLAKLKGEDDA